MEVVEKEGANALGVPVMLLLIASNQVGDVWYCRVKDTREKMKEGSI